MACSGEGLANVKLKWLCFPSSRMIHWKAAMEIHSNSHGSIPIPIHLFPLSFPFPWYSHCHCHSHGTYGNPMGPTHGIPIVPHSNAHFWYWRASRAVQGRSWSTGQRCTEHAAGTRWSSRCSTTDADFRLCRTDDLRSDDEINLDWKRQTG